MLQFTVNGRQITTSGMESLAVVKDLNIFKHSLFSVRSGLIGQMTADLTVWLSITKKYHADLFCGLFMRMSNEGLTISPQSLTALGREVLGWGCKT